MSERRLTMKLKKTTEAQSHSPASYDIYIENTLVGQLKSWSMPGIRGCPKGHEFKPLVGEEPVKGVGVRGIYRENLYEEALKTYEKVIRGRYPNLHEEFKS